MSANLANWLVPGNRELFDLSTSLHYKDQSPRQRVPFEENVLISFHGGNIILGLKCIEQQYLYISHLRKQLQTHSASSKPNNLIQSNFIYRSGVGTETKTDMRIDG